MQLAPIMRRLALALLLLAPACTGELGSGGPSSGTEPTKDPTIHIPRQEAMLLPFWVRLGRVASVVGKSVEDPLFDDFRTAHIELGDYDYASGVAPDRQWSPQRMASWAKALRKVCQSNDFEALYPALPADLESLIPAAYGRAATADDLALVDEALKDAPVDPALRSETICLAVLSSTEFVVQ